MKKIMLLIISIFLLSGCSAVYNVDLTNENSIKESLNIQEDDPSNDYFDYLNEYNDNALAFYTDQDPDTTAKDPDQEYYSIKNLSTSALSNILLEYNFNKKNINDSNIIKTCFNNAYLRLKKNDIYLNATKFLCFDKYPTLDKVTINIKTDKKIKSNNADLVNENVYTWNFSKKNYNEKSIILSTSLMKEEKENNLTNLYIILGVLGAFIIFIIIMIMYNSKKYNSKS